MTLALGDKIPTTRLVKRRITANTWLALNRVRAGRLRWLPTFPIQPFHGNEKAKPQVRQSGPGRALAQARRGKIDHEGVHTTGGKGNCRTACAQATPRVANPPGRIGATL